MEKIGNPWCFLGSVIHNDQPIFEDIWSPDLAEFVHHSEKIL